MMMNNTSNRKVVVAGHICLDITPIFPETCRVDIQQLFVPGKLINVENAQIHIGGAVGNTGLAMSFFGSNVRLMGKVGQDEFGEIVSRIVKAHGISSGMIISPSSHTSYSIVLAIPGQDRIFLHDPGANNTFDYADLDLLTIREAALFHFGYPPLMKRLYMKDGQELTRIFKTVSDMGLVTSMDMAAVDPMSQASREDWKSILANTLPYVDLFLPSVEELLFMLDRQKYDQLIKIADGKDLTSLIDIERDVKPLAEMVIQMGTKIALIKCGEPGLYFKSAEISKMKVLEVKLGFSFSNWANFERFESSFVPDKIVSTTGAGDVTIAAFLTALLAEYPLEMCLKYAVASGACCVEAYDSLSGLKSFKMIQEKMDAGWKQKSLPLK